VTLRFVEEALRGRVLWGREEGPKSKGAGVELRPCGGVEVRKCGVRTRGGAEARRCFQFVGRGSCVWRRGLRLRRRCRWNLPTDDARDQTRRVAEIPKDQSVPRVCRSGVQGCIANVRADMSPYERSPHGDRRARCYTVPSIWAYWICGKSTQITSKLACNERHGGDFL
jgi:hypothetical protein